MQNRGILASIAVQKVFLLEFVKQIINVCMNLQRKALQPPSKLRQCSRPKVLTLQRSDFCLVYVELYTQVYQQNSTTRMYTQANITKHEQ